MRLRRLTSDVLGSRARAALLLAAAALATWLAAAAPARAESPWWHLGYESRPANLPPGGEGTLVVQATNIGNEPTSGDITMTDTLPEGVTVQGVSYYAFPVATGVISLGHFCTTTANQVACTIPTELVTSAAHINPYEWLQMRIDVKVDAPSGENHVTIAGGEAPEASLSSPLSVNEAASPFAVSNYSLVPEDEGGAVDAQAGSHPYQLTTSFALNQAAESELEKSPALPRNLQFKLPPGLVGNVTKFPQCSELAFREVTGGGTTNLCPADTAIGVAVVTLDEKALGLTTLPVELFNLTPERGEPARFGFEVVRSPVILDTSVRTGGDYGVTVKVSNISELVNFISSTVTFWGVPGDPSHDQSRGWGCLAGHHWAEEEPGRPIPCLPSSAGRSTPFLTLPTSCAAPFATTVQGDSWPRRAEPAAEPTILSLPLDEYSLQDSFGRSLALTGCDRLPFGASIEVAPDSQQASTPTGLKVDVHVPQEANEDADALASSNLKDISVTLPTGVTLNPAGAGGLEACPESEVGYLPGLSSPPGELRFTPDLPSPSCPSASKVGTVKITSPLLANPVEGAVYLATPAPQQEEGSNPFKALVAMYIIARDPISGTLVKLPGRVSLDQASGRITATFENNPQLPFEDAELHFFGGSRAPLATPAHCGAYTTEATFTPWSGSEPVHSFSTFDITSGPNGGPCPGTLPFGPSLTAGTTNIDAGAFSPLRTTIGREDGNQDIQSVQLHMPAGLSGILTGVKLCPEAQANAGTCGAESRIGHTVVSVGLGTEPFSVTGGEVFLTEKYEGAPFGLSIVNPAVAGPFNLGTVVVRAKVAVDPHTAALSITTGTIPHILDGIPLQIKHVEVTIDRPGFTFNPSNCEPLSITGSIASVEGASSPVSTPFQVTNCAALKFTPSVTVTAGAHSSKANGSSLSFKIAYPKGAFGSQSWFNEAKFDIPKQLPARLTTIQKACLASVFESNRAACPAGSQIGHAVVRTPALPVPLTGPVYFVSHGGAKFPDAVLVLQGYGVTVDLVGETFINGKTGVTSATFRNTPDVPFESIEVSLPTGPGSEFGANLPASAHGSFCGRTLTMPTLFKAQNGLEIHQNTKVGVAGCAKAKAKHKKHVPAKHRKKR
ncbi:MAG TPA: hypothetical protein VHT29_11585 [Solirubrobacteraceae bacterium]|nr:hypothetical protein [Solirubrobacteraceae bacterium]